MSKFSVLMSVYKGTKTKEFLEAIMSVLNQTLPPSEILLFRDGEVNDDLQEQIDLLANNYKNLIKYFPYEKNTGKGNMYIVGIEKAQNDIVCMMDSDDISLPNRFELQVTYLENHPELTFVGGQIEEFIGNKENIISKREVKLNHDEIKEVMKYRNACNHVTSCYRRKAVLDVGNYIEIYGFEDYFMFLRLMQKGYKFANIPETLVLARVSDMYARRGGMNYFKSVKTVTDFKYKNKIISYSEYLKILIMRFVLHVIIPNGLRKYIFKAFGR